MSERDLYTWWQRGHLSGSLPADRAATSVHEDVQSGCAYDGRDCQPACDFFTLVNGGGCR